MSPSPFPPWSDSLRSVPPPSSPTPLPLRTRLVVAALSIGLGVVAVEGLLQLASLGALPHLALFESRLDGTIGLQADSSMALRRPDGGRYTVRTNAVGLRVEDGVGSVSPGVSPWLVVGDSQVLGMGVEAVDTFAARLGMRNAGVPGHGIADAVLEAERRVPDADPPVEGLVVVVNQANDWDEGLRTIGERYEVAHGRLIRRTATDGLGQRFWRSRLPTSQLLYYAAMVTTALTRPEDPAPEWLVDPAGQSAVSAELGGSLDALAQALAPTPVIVAFLPVDVATSEARVPNSPFGQHGVPGQPPWTDTSLRDQLQSELEHCGFVDLLPSLRDHPEAFLEHDYHLSPDGHRRVATTLAPLLTQAAPQVAP
jgi:hypothetical protein